MLGIGGSGRIWELIEANSSLNVKSSLKLFREQFSIVPTACVSAWNLEVVLVRDCEPILSKLEKRLNKGCPTPL